MTNMDTRTQLEQERKFDGATGAGLPALDGLPGVADVATGAPEDLDAVYYDTDDLRLLAHGVTLRRRTGGHDSGWHLKLPAGPDARTELQLPLRAGRPGRVPRELVLRTRVYARGAELAPVARLQTRRHRTLLLDADARELAEIARDAVSATDLRNADGPGLSTWTEVEAELVGGRTALLDAVEQRLSLAGLRRSTSPSKLGRALGRTPAEPGAATGNGAATGAGAAGPTAPGPGTIGAAVTALLRGLQRQLIAADPAVRADEPDAVHRMRITVRRLRSALKTHRDLFTAASGPGIAGLAEELRWLGAVLGEARDQEVLGELLGAEIARLGPEECPGPVGERVADWSRARYRSSWKAAAAVLDSGRYFALLDTLEGLTARPPLRHRAARRNSGRAFDACLRRERRRVGRRLSDASGRGAGPERDAALHEARKAAKRARYAGEGAQSVLGRPARRFARRMKAVQELLGARQDALLACRELPRLAAVAHAAGEPGFGYGVLYAAQRASIARSDAELPTALAGVLGSGPH
jgi:CHAD domain-containing protein